MLDRLADWLDAQPPDRRRLYSVLIAVTLLTLPCYAAGTVMLVLGEPLPAATAPPTSEATSPPSPTRPEAMPTLIERATLAPPTGVVLTAVPLTTIVWPTATATDEYFVITMPAIATVTVTTVPPATEVTPPTPPPATDTAEPPTKAPDTAEPATDEPATSEPATSEPSAEPDPATQTSP